MMYSRRSFLALAGTTALAGCGGGSILTPPKPLVSPEIAADINLVLNGLGMVMQVVRQFVSPAVFATMEGYYSRAVSLINDLLAATQRGDLVQIARQLYDVVTAFLGVAPVSQAALSTITTALRILLPIVISSLGVTMFAARAAASPQQVAWARETLRR